MTKELHVVIIKREKSGKQGNYKIQYNLCKKLLGKTKNSYFSNFDTKKITNNTTFWKTVVLLFTSKSSKSENIINEGDKSISDEKKLCQIFNTFFIPNPSNYFKEEKFHSLLTIIENFEKHPSVTNIKNKDSESIFCFKETTPEEVVKVICNLNIRKSCQITDIPTKVIKLNLDILAKFIYRHFNYCIERGEFPNELKHAELVPVQKKTCK